MDNQITANKIAIDVNVGHAFYRSSAQHSCAERLLTTLGISLSVTRSYCKGK